MKVLMFGQTGQVAREICNLAGEELAVTALGRKDADLRDPDRCADLILRTDADVVLNAAAFTAVDKAESDVDTAMCVNAVAPEAMARACRTRGLPFLHISSDYVFGHSHMKRIRETDEGSPLNIYGQSKLIGDKAIEVAGGKFVVLRTSWLYSTYGSNFVKTMLKLGRERSRLTVVNDQFGGPTSAKDVAETLVTIARRFLGNTAVSGTYHFCGSPAVSWYRFAQEIFSQAGLVNAPKVVPITSAEWPAPAERPMHAILQCQKIADVYGIEQPSWRDALRPVVSQLVQSEAPAPRRLLEKKAVVSSAAPL